MPGRNVISSRHQGFPGYVPAACVSQGTVAAQLGQIEPFLTPFPYIRPGGDAVGGGIKRFHINAVFPERHGIHTAADIDAHAVGDSLIPDGHRRSDGATLACVHIGHDPYPAATCKLVIAHPADLRDRTFIHDSNIANGGIYLSLDFKYCDSP